MFFFFSFCKINIAFEFKLICKELERKQITRSYLFAEGRKVSGVKHPGDEMSSGQNIGGEILGAKHPDPVISTFKYLYKTNFSTSQNEFF